MEYSAGNVSNLLWFVETRETARLLSNGTMEEVAEKIVKDNLYQQKDIKRAKRQFNVIKKRLLAIPDSLVRLITSSDINTAKLIVFIGCMATDRSRQGLLQNSSVHAEQGSESGNRPPPVD